MSQAVAPVVPYRRQRLWWALAGVLLAAGAFAAWQIARNRVPDRAPPEVVLEGVDPEVAESVKKARAEVLRAPRTATAWGELGEVLHAHLFYPEALECYAQAELLAPEEPRWPYNQGMIHFPDRSEAALVKLRRAAELAPTKPDTITLRLAELLCCTGHTDEARERYEALLRADPGNAGAHLGMARIALAASEYDNCARHATACLGSPYCRKAAHTVLSELRYRQGDATGAEKEQERATGTPPDLTWPDPFSQRVSRRKVGEKARARHATRLMDQGQYGESVAELRRLVEDYPSSAQAWMMLGYSLMMNKDDVGAKRALARAIELDGSQPRSHFYLGIVLHRTGDRTAAAARFRDAIAAKPDYAMAHFNLGVTLKEDGHRAKAIEAFRAALRCQPGQSQSHAQLGELLLQEGHTNEARGHLEHAVQLNPRDKRAAELLAGLK